MNSREYAEQFDENYYTDLIDEVIDEVFEEDNYYYDLDTEAGIDFFDDGMYRSHSPEEDRAMGDDMLYPTYNLFGEWK